MSRKFEAVIASGADVLMQRDFVCITLVGSAGRGVVLDTKCTSVIASLAPNVENMVLCATILVRPCRVW